MTTQRFEVTYTAHAVVIRGCCGNTDDICNCQPGTCQCPAPEGEPNG